MDSEVASLLTAWGFERFKQTFEENEVDIEALKLLDTDQIKTLIPAIGPQAKFKKALTDWNTANAKINLEPDADLQNLVETYGSNVGGLTSSLSSPIGSPSISSRSDVSSISQISTLPHLLKTTPDGRNILKQSNKEALGENLRKILVNIIAKDIVRTEPQASVTAKTYHYWIEEIKTLFPSENGHVYYTKSEGPNRAHGRLFDAVTNLKAKYRRNKVFEPRARRTLIQNSNGRLSSSDHLQELVNANEEIEAETEQIEEDLEWLRANVDDYDKCAEKWKNTEKYRLRKVLSSSDATSVIEEFPCLKRSWGHFLLKEDFERWYPGNESALEDKIHLIKQKLLTAAEKISRKSLYVAQLKALVRAADAETSCVATFLLIPHLMGPMHYNKKKLSSDEVRQNFILQIENDTELTEAKRKRLEKYSSTGMTIQPYVVIAGPLGRLTNRYVIVDNATYELPTINEAIDTCFKIIWSLNLEYPKECIGVWQFIQRSMYKFPEKSTPKDKLSSAVLSLLNDCGIVISQ